jgi:type VI protein secretion system component VasK
MKHDDTPEWLRARLSALPKEIAPARDLWPDIARRLDGRKSFHWMPLAAAASVLISIAAVWITWQAAVEQRHNAALLLQAQQTLQQIQQPYLPARAAYAAQWPALRGQLDPETAAVVERNLEIIRSANAELSRALERNPDSPVLQQLLHRTLAQEVALYRRVESASRPGI